MKTEKGLKPIKNSLNRRQFLGAAAAAAALPSVGVPTATTTLPTPTMWPGDRGAAISLTFDDAMQTHLDNAGPILKKHGLNGTFFVVTGPSSTWRKRPDDWKRLAAEGNEIASHTVHHPCMLKAIKPHSQDYTPDMMLREIRESSEDIINRLGVRRGLTFAYPCGDMTFGGEADLARSQARYMEFVAQYYFAARGYNSWAPVVAEDINPLTVPVLGWTFGKDFPSLLAQLEPVRQGHNWGVYVFHGVGGQWLSVRKETFDELAGYLAQHTEIWTATFGDVVRYIQESRALKVQAGESSDDRHVFALSWPLDSKVYDLPVTLKWKLPSSWNSCTAQADGRPVKCSIKASEGAKAALADVAAQTKTLRFAKEQA
jgi:peptidoglycan/xylan/chitin deacetylase (PgdA/CDA1 family)